MHFIFIPAHISLALQMKCTKSLVSRLPLAIVAELFVKVELNQKLTGSTPRLFCLVGCTNASCLFALNISSGLFVLSIGSVI